MFGRRNGFSQEPVARSGHPPAPPTKALSAQNAAPALNGNISVASVTEKPYGEHQTDEYYELKGQIFTALLEIIDVSQLTKMEADRARAEIRAVVNEILIAKKVAMSAAERQELLDDMCNDILGYGPLQPLLARDDIADIMVNGTKRIFIEVNGKVRE